jgi:hypothetical protein
VAVEEDAPRLVMEVLDLVQATELGLDQCLCIVRHSVVVRDNRPLYTFAVSNPPKTRHDNLEPHIRANFPPTAEELAEMAAEALVEGYVEMRRIGNGSGNARRDVANFAERWVRTTRGETFLGDEFGQRLRSDVKVFVGERGGTTRD